MKYYTIYLDGIDKTGKDSILPYIGPLCKYKYICNVRGIMTQIAYSDLYQRKFDYDLYQQKECLNVLLTVNKDDWLVRCAVTREPKISYEEHRNAFEAAYKKLQDAGCPVLTLNTSFLSPYAAAKLIVDYIDEMNGEL